nr:ribonuclease H-like domain-containing protein [Tanacetum cinerariifolium]
MFMNYQSVFARNQTNGNAGTKANIDARQAGKKIVPGSQYVLLPLLTFDSQGPRSSEDKVADDAGKKNQEEALRKKCEQEFERLFGQGEAANTNSTNRLNTISSPVNAVSSSFTTVDPGRERAQRNEFESMFGQYKDANGNRMFTPISAAGSTYVNLGGSIPINDATLPNADLHTNPLMPNLEDTVDLQDTGIFSGAYDDEVEGVVADFNNLELTTVVSHIPITRIHKDHPKEKIIRDPLLAPQTRRMTKTSQEHAVVYVNDIIFGSTKKSLCTEFEGLMHKKFQISSMEELTFFLGLQLMQRDDGIFISQDKYVADILKKFDFSSMKTASTLIETNKALLKDEEAKLHLKSRIFML